MDITELTEHDPKRQTARVIQHSSEAAGTDSEAELTRIVEKFSGMTLFLTRGMTTAKDRNGRTGGFIRRYARKKAAKNTTGQ